MPKKMIYEVEVYVATGAASCETIFVTIEGNSEDDVQAKILTALKAKSEHIQLGSGTFQKEKVLGTCLIGALRKR